MGASLKEELLWHWSTTVRLIRLTPPWILLIPFVAMACLYQLDKLPQVAPFIAKGPAEVYGPIVSFVNLAAAGHLARRPRRPPCRR
jgi:hypothetical protein